MVCDPATDTVARRAAGTLAPPSIPGADSIGPRARDCPHCTGNAIGRATIGWLTSDTAPLATVTQGVARAARKRLPLPKSDQFGWKRSLGLLLPAPRLIDASNASPSNASPSDTGSDTCATCARISPPGNVALWMLTYA